MGIDSKTRLCGLIGDPVEHSASPAMQNAAFEKAGLNIRYICFRVPAKQLSDAIRSIRVLGFVGFNVTVPHKQEVMRFLDRIDPVAYKIGAVNTLVCRGPVIEGYNTDWVGAVEALERVTLLKGKKCVLLGAGGAARGVAYGLLKRGAELVILNRTQEKAETLAEEFGCKSGGLAELESLKGDIIINATSVGLDSEDCIAGKSQLEHFKIAFDVIYNKDTRFLRIANAAGCRTVDGLWMLVHQGAAAFELWTGKKPDTPIMYSAAKKAIRVS